jgi:hypothetical protein
MITNSLRRTAAIVAMIIAVGLALFAPVAVAAPVDTADTCVTCETDGDYAAWEAAHGRVPTGYGAELYR